MDHAVLAGTWRPLSPCSPACLPTSRCRLVGPRLRVATRLTAVVAVLLAALATAPWTTARSRERWLRTVSAAMLRAIGVQVRVTAPAGAAPRWSGVLVVANHVSWIDALALAAVAPIRIVAKREVRGWPLVGGLAVRAGASFIDRTELRRLPDTVGDLGSALRAGGCVAVFPEGTTWCGAAAGPFRRAAFQAALDAQAPVLRGDGRAPRTRPPPDRRTGPKLSRDRRTTVDVDRRLGTGPARSGRVQPETVIFERAGFSDEEPALRAGRGRGGFRRLRTFGPW